MSELGPISSACQLGLCSVDKVRKPVNFTDEKVQIGDLVVLPHECSGQSKFAMSSYLRQNTSELLSRYSMDLVQQQQAPFRTVYKLHHLV